MSEASGRSTGHAVVWSWLGLALLVADSSARRPLVRLDTPPRAASLVHQHDAPHALVLTAWVGLLGLSA